MNYYGCFNLTSVNFSNIFTFKIMKYIALLFICHETINDCFYKYNVYLMYSIKLKHKYCLSHK